MVIALFAMNGIAHSGPVVVFGGYVADGGVVNVRSRVIYPTGT